VTVGADVHVPPLHVGRRSESHCVEAGCQRMLVPYSARWGWSVVELLRWQAAEAKRRGAEAWWRHIIARGRVTIVNGA
jgi:hypothetical protein